MRSTRTFHSFIARGAVAALVAQVCNLLYRRFVIGRTSKASLRLAVCKPAIQQIENLRYGLVREMIGLRARLAILAAGVLAFATGMLLAADVATITVQADKPGAKINPAMWGIFFEDINFGADGGLYAELVKNGAFEFPEPLMGWSQLSSGKSRGALSVHKLVRYDGSWGNGPGGHYLRIESEGDGVFGIANEGYRGMGVRQGEAYQFSAMIRRAGGDPALQIQLYNSNGALLDSARFVAPSSVFEKYSVELHPKATDARSKLQLLVDGAGAIELDMVSLFPRKTWKNRPGGLRADMVQMLADLKPGFMRFPGGCIVEGNVLTNRYQWKTTIGPLAERKLIINRWNFEFKHRPTPDYFQSFGLGFFEFFQLCEDIGAAPLPILNCGMACQFNSGELCPLDQLEPYIQDALDLVEFANGPATSPWGAKRAAMGHAQPFNMKLLGIGNEQWGTQYVERYARFAKALKEKHPEIQLVSSAGPSPADDRFNFLWPKLRELNADIVDEHCYANPKWFFENTRRFDNYDRNGPKVFFGEYAAQSDKVVSVNNRNNWECALSEAAFMTGLERNSDVVRMSSYAPLFAHEDAWQWRPNLIWCDNLRIFGTPSYYVQQLFSRNRGDIVLPVELPSTAASPRLFASAVRDEQAKELIIKLVNAEPEQRSVELNLAGLARVKPKARVMRLTADSLSAENSFAEPRKVAPVESEVRIPSPRFTQALPANSLTVLRVKAEP